jgi:hypothetical protein
MSIRARKLVGTVMILLFIAGYALAAMLIAAGLQVRFAGGWVELGYYIVAGLLWTLPVGWLIGWMQRP